MSDDTASPADTSAADSATDVAVDVATDAKPLLYENIVLDESGDTFCGRFGDVYYLYLPDQVHKDGKVIGGRVVGFTSTDLVHWKAHGEVYSNVADTYGGKSTIGLWAPEVMFRDGKYYLYYASLTDNPKDDRVGDKDIVVVESADPLDFKGGKRTVLLDDDYAFIDPSPFQDPMTGKLHLLFKRRGVFGTGSENDIRPMSSPTAFDGPATTLVESEKIPASEQITEHPMMRRDGSTLFLLFSAGNGAGTTYRIDYATSSSTTGPFDYRGTLFESDPMLGGDLSKKVISPGAPSIVRDGAGDTWMVYRQKTTIDDTFAQRGICIDPISIDGAKNEITGHATKGVLRPAPKPI
ncbi:MAG: family 43 glycosylhydrolase [Polyangiales bacterium]